MPPNPQKAPIPVDKKIMTLNLLVKSLATIGGITIAAAIKVTPNIWIETTIVAANTIENIVASQPIGTPYDLATS